MNTGGAIAGVLAPTLTGILLQFTGNFQKSLLLGSLMILIAAFCMLFVVREISPISQEHYSV
jgi:ACS family glucarate transporter-like MFS transporter